LGVTEEADGVTFIPGEDADEVVSALQLGTAPGTRLGFRIRNRAWTDSTGTPVLDTEGNPRISNEIKSVWALRT
jgi:hypothetical protein